MGIINMDHGAQKDMERLQERAPKFDKPGISSFFPCFGRKSPSIRRLALLRVENFKGEGGGSREHMLYCINTTQ
jgi:hypothetical protein